MSIDDTLDLMDHSSLDEFIRRFRSLRPPLISDLSGRYQAHFTGPLWLRKSAAPAIAMGGMPGWWGKEFCSGGEGFNLLKTGQRHHPDTGTDFSFRSVLPFHLSAEPSLVDQKPGISVRYNTGCPFPWMHILDELRWLNMVEGTLLGMTIINAPILRRMAFPFLLIQSNKG